MPTPTKIYYGSSLIYQQQGPQWYTGSDEAFNSSTDMRLNLTTVATDASANTKGSWVELVASTAFASQMLSLIGRLTGASGANNCALADIGIGAAGSETVLVADIGVGNTVSNYATWDIPIAVPSGSRLSVRWQAARASAASASFAVMLNKAGGGSAFTAPTSVDTLGADTTSSTGVGLGTTPGTFVQVTASASKAYRGFVVCLMNDDTSMSSSGVTCAVGIGPGGSEVAYRCTQHWQPGNNEALDQTVLGTTYVPAPCNAGDRISLRWRDSIGSNYASGGTKFYNAVLIGIPA